jgi:hypothetical protein
LGGGWGCTGVASPQLAAAATWRRTHSPTQHGAMRAAPPFPSPARFTWLLSPLPAGGGGCASEPDVLSALFNTAAALCKALVGELTAALPQTLKHTAGVWAHACARDTCACAAVRQSWPCLALVTLASLSHTPRPALLRRPGLRYHPEHHVRVLAAEAFGFLLRAAKPRRALRAGLRALLAEAAVRPRPERLHGAGLLCAEAVLGPEHGLHSRTPVLLGLLLQVCVVCAVGVCWV